MKLTEKTILITGGNSGIGLQLASQLHAMGNQIIVISRSQHHWESLQQRSPAIITMQCDLSRKDQVLHLGQQLHKDAIQIDALIHCAAIQNTAKLTDDDFDVESVDHEVTTNFTAPVWLSYLLLPILRSQPEAIIVNLSSGLAFYPKSSSSVYCASKAAIHNFSQSLRYQLADSSVQVMEVILPLVDTPMTKGRGSGKISPQQAAEEIIQGIEKSKDEIYVGKARIIPLLMRLCPGILRRMLAKY